MGSYSYYNPNPHSRRVGDCAVRALSKALNQDWDKTYLWICIYGFIYKDMPNGNATWGIYLKDKGFTRQIIPDTCPDCYTLNEFCCDRPKGTYIVVLSGHVVAVIDGCIYDTWDSGNEIPIYYWSRKENK